MCDPVPSRSGTPAMVDESRDRHNLRVIQSDPLLQTLLTRYRCMTESQRKALLAAAAKIME